MVKNCIHISYHSFWKVLVHQVFTIVGKKLILNKISKITLVSFGAPLAGEFTFILDNCGFLKM